MAAAADAASKAMSSPLAFYENCWNFNWCEKYIRQLDSIDFTFKDLGLFRIRISFYDSSSCNPALMYI